jgi:integrase/recombinase XerD
MKILEIYKEKLRYKKYSNRSIKLYISYLASFINIEKIKDPYQVTTHQIISFLENYPYTSTSQQNQYIGALKLFARYILNKKNIHLNKMERPKSEKRLPRVIDGNYIKLQLSKITNIKHKTILTLTYSVGLRVSEIVNLKIEDIDSETNKVVLSLPDKNISVVMDQSGSMTFNDSSDTWLVLECGRK